MNRSSLVFILLAALLLSGLFMLDTGPKQKVLLQAPDVTALVEPTGLSYRFYDPFEVEIQYDEYQDPVAYALGENYMPGKKPFAQEHLEITLPLDGVVEYKAIMDEGDSIVYRWQVKKGETYFDFHGHPTTGETEFYNRYRVGESDSGSGSIVAAFSGQHGWYWMNISDHPIVIELEVAGFFDRIERIGLE
jgi:hypothetical protein